MFTVQAAHIYEVGDKNAAVLHMILFANIEKSRWNYKDQNKGASCCLSGGRQFPYFSCRIYSPSGYMS